MKYINCYKCGKHLGQIEKAKIKKNIGFVCEDCKHKEMLNKEINPILDIFKTK